VPKPQSGLVLNAQFEQDGPLLFEHACALGCGGIVSKRKGVALSLRPFPGLGEKKESGGAGWR